MSVKLCIKLISQLDNFLCSANIERRKQEESERNIERIKSETKEQSLRVAIIADSVASFESIEVIIKVIGNNNSIVSDRLQKVREHKKSTRQDDDWKKFLKCENLPDTTIPSDVREFIYKWKTSLSEYWDEQINWWLKCDDRSVLTQDPDQNDTRRKLTKKIRESTGKFYDRKLRMMLRVYNSLVDALRRKMMTPERYEDLITVELFLLFLLACELSLKQIFRFRYATNCVTRCSCFWMFYRLR